MKKNDCNIIRDLMPLVLDRVASDESREAVEDHIGTCGECRKQYEEMKADMPAETRAEYEEEQRTIVEALRKVKRQQKKRRIIRIALPVMLSLAVLIGGMFLYAYLCVWDDVTVDNNLYTLHIAQLKDGTIDVTVEEPDMITGSRGGVCSEEYADGKDNICYICLTTTRVNNIQTVPGAIYRYSIMSFDNSDDSVTEIRQGKPDNYVVIWKKGNPLPAASEEMEAWYEMEREFDARFQETDELDLEEYNRKSKEIYATVPEWN